MTADSSSVACPHCGSTTANPLPPSSPDRKLTWYFCAACGHVFNVPTAADLYQTAPKI